MPSPQFVELLVLIGIALLRFGVPFLITAGVAWWLYRLDVKWRGAAPVIATSPTDTPAARAIDAHSRIIGEPCWVYRACPEQVRDKCPAYLQPELPCWLARLRGDGRLTGGCRCCSIFATGHTAATLAGD